MSKEVSNLIKENQELLETKFVQWKFDERHRYKMSSFRNALNVVKDDLLAQIEELSK